MKLTWHKLNWRQNEHFTGIKKQSLHSNGRHQTTVHVVPCWNAEGDVECSLLSWYCAGALRSIRSCMRGHLTSTSLLQLVEAKNHCMTASSIQTSRSRGEQISWSNCLVVKHGRPPRPVGREQSSVFALFLQSFPLNSYQCKFHERTVTYPSSALACWSPGRQQWFAYRRKCYSHVRDTAGMKWIIEIFTDNLLLCVQMQALSMQLKSDIRQYRCIRRHTRLRGIRNLALTRLHATLV